MLASCVNDSDSTEYGATDYSTCTLVTGFSLSANRKIMDDLDSVFFSIDLVNRRIYNADSLPCGTDVSRLIINVTVPNEATLKVDMPSRFSGQDTIINLTDNPKDSINFAGRPVYLQVTAPNTNTIAHYTVEVNVHKVEPDSLTWSKSDRGNLPTTIANPTAQRTVRFGSDLLCLTGSARRTTLSTTSTPFDFSSWVEKDVVLPTGADINTFSATTDGLYIVCTDGSLHRADDATMDWTEVEPAGSGWTHLYGGFADKVVGVRGSDWATYPAGASGSLDALGADFPVKQTSQLVSYSSDWDIHAQALMAGGVTASGSHTGTCWGFDGTAWFRLSSTNGVRTLPASEGYTIFPYFNYLTSTNFVVTKRAVWLAIGYFRDSAGAISSKVYISQDNGISWNLAPDNLQLPDDIAPRYQAQAFVCAHTITASRAIKPITEWDADYVYLFGGYYFDSYDEQTKLRNQLWRGLIERMAFKPLQ